MALETAEQRSMTTAAAPGRVLCHGSRPLPALDAHDRWERRHPPHGCRRAGRGAGRLPAEAQLVRPRRRHRAADALQRLRFEHPEVGAVVITVGQGPHLLRRREHLHARQSSHALKVNFCKFTNETRLELEDVSADSGQIVHRRGQRHRAGRRLRARPRVRRDPAHRRRIVGRVACPSCRCSACFPGPAASPASSTSGMSAATSPTCSCTRAEGVTRQARRRVGPGGRDAPAQGSSMTPSKRVPREVASRAVRPAPRQGIRLDAARASRSTDDEIAYEHVSAALDRRARRRRRSRFRGPRARRPPRRRRRDALGAALWPLAHRARARRRCSSHLRFNEPTIGTWVMQDRGRRWQAVLAVDRSSRWSTTMRTGSSTRSCSCSTRVLKRLDVTAEPLRVDRARELLRRAPARARARVRPQFMLDGATRRRCNLRRSSLTDSNAGPSSRWATASRASSRVSSGASAERERRRRTHGSTRSMRRRRRRSGSSPSRRTTSTGTTRCASPSRSARVIRPTR